VSSLLFNFQGASLPSLADSLYIISPLSPFVKPFFKLFSKSFSSDLLGGECIYYSTSPPPMSRAFFNNFDTFPQKPARAAS
ncbi:MAG: hypothetical protein IJZ08_02430, partial [Clostridia bacterium]|nr:hypothetical protein [Clostridia bacterium]